MHFKIDWASLIVGNKFTVFALFSLYLRAIFQVQALGAGGLSIWRGNLTEGVFALLVWGAYIWRSLFSEFYNTCLQAPPPLSPNPHVFSQNNLL